MKISIPPLISLSFCIGINQLKSKIIIPPLSPGPGVHFVWAGLENRPGSFVYQSVIGDEQNPGYWSYATWYGPDMPASPPPTISPLPTPASSTTAISAEQSTEVSTEISGYHEFPSTRIRVLEGDTVTSILELDVQTGVWTSSWSIVPGAISNSAAVIPWIATDSPPQSGFISTSFPEHEAEGGLRDVVFEIELQKSATWDFGPQVWENVYMETNSTDTSWCIKASLVEYGFEIEMSLPIMGHGVDEGGRERSWCFLKKIEFVSPREGRARQKRSWVG